MISVLMKVFLKTEDEIELMRNANQLVSMTLTELAKCIKPGISTLQLDRIAEELADLGDEIGVQIKTQREEIFNMMHRL